jgi:hypothetical protein
MKKLMVLCAAALLTTACAKVEGERSGQNRGPVPFATNQPLNQRPVMQNPQVQQQQNLNPQNMNPQVRPNLTTVWTGACAANVIREIRLVKAEKIDRKNKDKFVVNEDSATSTKLETIIKTPKGKILSRVETDGPSLNDAETYDFSAQTIKSDAKKIRFALNKDLTAKNKKDTFSMNQADLTASIYASIDIEADRLSEKGKERVCSFLATGRFFLSKSAESVETRILLTETHQLDPIAYKSLIRELNRQ